MKHIKSYKIFEDIQNITWDEIKNTLEDILVELKDHHILNFDYDIKTKSGISSGISKINRNPITSLSIKFSMSRDFRLFRRARDKRFSVDGEFVEALKRCVMYIESLGPDYGINIIGHDFKSFSFDPIKEPEKLNNLGGYFSDLAIYVYKND